ncbi:MAG: CinA family protein [Anaerolineae bacterium]|nr:CinA family protein [Anaerolineae bacterium]
MSDERLEAKVGDLLLGKGWTVGTAESCTGGLVLHRLTNVAGSSAYVLGGVVAYSNAIKQSVLRVRHGTLIAYGAVSEQVALEMAQGARALLSVDVAVSITGIAGPGGGTPEKPVGLTYIALVGPNNLQLVERQVWDGDREANKAASAEAALLLLQRALANGGAAR